MSDEQKKDMRPWWRKKTNWGLLTLGAAGTLAAVPGAPVLFTIGAVGVTTTVLATALQTVGTILAGYGIADRVTKK